MSKIIAIFLVAILTSMGIAGAVPTMTYDLENHTENHTTVVNLIGVSFSVLGELNKQMPETLRESEDGLNDTRTSGLEADAASAVAWLHNNSSE